MRKTHLPIAQPCHEEWDAMDPVHRGRFCNSCSKQVYHLSAMTEREAKAVLEQSVCDGESICVRYRCDRQGVIQFKPERNVVAAAAAVLTMALAACSPHEHPDHQRTAVLPMPALIDPDPEPLMGEPMIDPEIIDIQQIPASDPEVEEVEELMGEPELEPQPCALTHPDAAKAPGS